MTRLGCWYLSACLLMATVPGCLADAAEGSIQAVRTGERLTYDITWLNILAGTAVMEVQADGAGTANSRAKLVTTAQSRPAISKFFPVDNRVESEFDLQTQLPLHMIFHRREGKNKEDIEYTFHHAEGTVTAVRQGTSETLPIPAGTQDLISCLYYVRNQLPMTPGASLTLNVHHDKKNRQVEVRVEKLETLEGVWGRVETAQLVVIMPFKGIFINKGNIRVWFTTDERRIPVRMKAKVIIGAIVADLVDGFPSPKGPS
jgi:Protein of unknown function (DUF3108)